jgi:hypothetical protein
MKIWWMRYKGVGDSDWTSRPHVSKESAERDGCYTIITKGLDGSLDPEGADTEVIEGVLKFFGLVELGGYAQALAFYADFAEAQDWNEGVKIEEEFVFDETQVPLLQAVAASRPAWVEAYDENKAEEEEDDVKP